jgi:large subunit ribosomal protein L1
MGKIKIRTIGTEEEEQEKKDQKKRREEKKAVHVPGMKGGERVVAVGPTEEELAKVEEVKESESAETAEPLKKKKSIKKTKKRARSKRYQSLVASLDRTKEYSLPDALELLEKSKRGWDETVELHINTLEPGVSAITTLPHGTHKKTRVVVASDALISEIEKGKIEFDVLLADPSMMPKLAKVAKVLGPRGLMPNPKAGTITNDPEEAAKKFEQGQLRIKTEAKAAVIHVSVGKMSFGSKKLSDNIKAVVEAVKKENIKKVVVKSTQSPAIKVLVN